MEFTITILPNQSVDISSIIKTRAGVTVLENTLDVPVVFKFVSSDNITWICKVINIGN